MVDHPGGNPSQGGGCTGEGAPTTTNTTKTTTSRRELVLSRSKHLAFSWSKHTNGLADYKALWAPITHWLHIDCLGMNCCFISVACMRRNHTRFSPKCLPPWRTCSPVSGWYMSSPIGEWNSSTDPEGCHDCEF